MGGCSQILHGRRDNHKIRHSQMGGKRSQESPLRIDTAAVSQVHIMSSHSRNMHRLMQLNPNGTYGFRPFARTQVKSEDASTMMRNVNKIKE
ncbi:hypothetical protein Bhyg_09590 [Pseudolycoriella hygida]|uniref:Uncharacterized protein n=1 Tax=Pseudolycoriella hygida TaxID=35572 RepID=A0A9Q0N7W2_9DIPT|nr:hypothetical protein Bhyg_09590 [Pseudolycoriella hygida]